MLDDLTKIQENSDLRTPFHLRNFIYPYADAKMHFRNDPSRPLTFMAYWLCWQTAPGSPYPFHILSTILHGLSAALLGLLMAQLSLHLWRETSLGASMTAALLFLCSPMLAGTVVYAYGLSDVLCATLILASLLAFSGRGQLRGRNLVTMNFLYLLALATKQSAIVLPGLVLAWDLFVRPSELRTRNEWLRKYLPLTAISLGYLTLRWFYFGGLGDLEGADQLLPWFSYAEAEGALIYKYLWQTLWPSGLSIDHRVFPDAWPGWLNACAWLSIFGFGALALAQISRGPLRRCVSFGWLFFIVCLLPTSSVLPTVDLYVERRAYLADVGLFLVVGGLFCAAAQRSASLRKILVLICAVLVSLEAAFAYGRIQVYHSPEKLWKESLSLDPENPRALLNLGVYFSAVGRFAEARTALEDLLHAQPQNGSILSKLGYLYQQPLAPFHDEEKAWDYFTQSLQLYPENIFALYNSGVWLMNHGRNAEAEDFFVRTIRLSPQMSKAYLAAGQAALVQDRRVQAIQYLEEALRLDPTLIDAQTLLAKLRP